jgi:hypothetical protein
MRNEFYLISEAAFSHAFDEMRTAQEKHKVAMSAEIK